jgi:four helix bundle protein
MRDYKKLQVWQKAHQQYLFIRKSIAPKIPRDERYELSRQLLRASLSIPLNIVEGCGRFTDKDFTHFLDNALGSANEVDYCCLVAFELNYVTKEEYGAVNLLINETRAMLISFIKYLRSAKTTTPKP